MTIYTVVAHSDYESIVCGPLNNVAYLNRDAAKAHAEWMNKYPDVEDAIYNITYYAGTLEIPDSISNEFVPPMTEEEYIPIKEELERWCRGECEDPDYDYPDGYYDDPSM